MKIKIEDISFCRNNTSTIINKILKIEFNGGEFIVSNDTNKNMNYKLINNELVLKSSIWKNNTKFDEMILSKDKRSLFSIIKEVVIGNP